MSLVSNPIYIVVRTKVRKKPPTSGLARLMHHESGTAYVHGEQFTREWADSFADYMANRANSFGFKDSMTYWTVRLSRRSAYVSRNGTALPVEVKLS